MKNAEEMLSRGTGNFINCTDYDDAVEAIKKAQEEAYNEAIQDASNVVREPYEKSGMTNLANRAYQSILNLKK